MQALLVGFATWAMGSFLAKILLSAGLSIATYVGVSTFVEDALDSLSSQIGNLGSATAILQLAGVGEFVSIVGSAMLTSLAIKSAQVFLVRS